MSNCPSVSFRVEKIIDVISVEGALKNFKVQWAPTWVSSFNLTGCEKLIEEFLIQRCEGDEPNHVGNIECISSVHNDPTQVLQKQSNVIQESLLSSSEDKQDNIDIISNVEPLTDEQPVPLIKLEEVNSSYVGMSPMIMENGSLCLQENNEQTILQDTRLLTEENISSFRNLPNIFEASMVAGKGYYERRGVNLAQDIESKEYGESSRYQAFSSGECVKRSEYSIDKELLSDPDNQQNDELEMEKQHVHLNNDGLVQSIKAKKLIIESMYKCISCSMTFIDERDYSEHKCFFCSYCWKTFYDESTFVKHKLLHRRSIKQNYESTAVNNSSEYYSLVSNNNETKIANITTCHVCLKTFSNKYKLKRHMLSHTGQRDFQCDVCGKRFSRTDVLDRHLSVHKGKKGKEPDKSSHNSELFTKYGDDN